MLGLPKQKVRLREEGVVFVLDGAEPSGLYLCILYIACHMVLTHHITLAGAFELVSA